MILPPLSLYKPHKKYINAGISHIPSFKTDLFGMSKLDNDEKSSIPINNVLACSKLSDRKNTQEINIKIYVSVIFDKCIKRLFVDNNLPNFFERKIISVKNLSEAK